MNIATRKLEAHVWEREANEHYVEPEWCARRLFEEEKFIGAIHDPSCGFGTIPKAAIAHGLVATGSDLVDRGYGPVVDFMQDEADRENIVCNPPFRVIEQFMIRALQKAQGKVAAIIPVARLNAAHWLRETPLKTVWLMTPRPSMPPGHVIAAGEKPGGGKADFCWLVWERGHNGTAEIKWLRRDG